MNTTGCGCQPCTCGCCQGTTVLTPVEIYNPPGQSTLSYRVGTHARFLQSMKARLSSQDFPALAKLTTRDPGDFSIALLDGWAMVGDVLSFYQERIAIEGYLRTASERKSVLELARLVGYAPRPGVSATVYLAYTLDQGQNVTIPKGSRAQSVPKPGQLPQSFETAEALGAYAALNAIPPRLKKPQYITLDNLQTLYTQGIAANLKVGDILLLGFSGNTHALARVKKAETDPLQNHTALELDLLDPTLATKAKAVVKRFIKFTDFGISENNNQAKGIARKIEAAANPIELLDELKAKATAPSTNANVASWLKEMVKELQALTPKPVTISEAAILAEDTTTPLAKVVGGLLKPASLPPASSRVLQRNLTQIYARESDQLPVMFGALFPAIREKTYLGYANTRPAGDAPLQSLEVMRVKASLFGHNIVPLPEPPVIGIIEAAVAGFGVGTAWADLGANLGSLLALDGEYSQIKAGSQVVIRRPKSEGDSTPIYIYASVQSVDSLTLKAANVAAKVSVLHLGFGAGTTQWLTTAEQGIEKILRQTQVYAAGEALPLALEPITLEIAKEGQVVEGESQDLELDALYQGLESGRWAIVYGERSDIPGTTGVYGAELLMIASVEHRFARVSSDGKNFIDLPGDTRHTFVRFAKPLEYTYKRETVLLYANVVKASHGETKVEVLGGGDASKAFQTFVLKQPPLTYTAAPTAAGAESTLEVRVNGVDWHQTASLVGLAPTDRVYQIRIDDDGKISVVFGNGKQGARLPTSLENVQATYRSGIGMPGNVEARQISLLMTKPLGVKDVINPLPASGGADRESRDLARKNAPKAIQALDRLVSVQDYADFAQSFAGIGKASASELRGLVHVTIAGAEDIPIDPTSDLFRNLLLALQTLGDPYQTVVLALRELKLLVVEAKVRLLPDYNWENVEPQIRSSLLDSFGFERRELAQSVFASEVISSIQAIPGVAYLDLETFGALGAADLATGNPLERLKFDPQGQPLPLPKRVLARPARYQQGKLLAAELIFLSPQAPDTLILTEIQ